MVINQDRMKAQLVKHEGLRYKPYRDQVGKLTIGIGRNLDDVGISKEEAFFLCENDVADRMDFLNKIEWINSLSEIRQRVLVDMAFNLGTGGLMNFKDTMAAIRAKNFEGAARNMLSSRWALEVPTRAKRLSTMMRTGEDSKDF